MELKIPVIYRATVIPKTGKHPHVKFFREKIRAELREIGSEEAPVAIRAKVEPSNVNALIQGMR